MASEEERGTHGEARRERIRLNASEVRSERDREAHRQEEPSAIGPGLSVAPAGLPEPDEEDARGRDEGEPRYEPQEEDPVSKDPHHEAAEIRIDGRLHRHEIVDGGLLVPVRVEEI